MKGILILLQPALTQMSAAHVKNLYDRWYHSLQFHISML